MLLNLHNFSFGRSEANIKGVITLLTIKTYDANFIYTHVLMNDVIKNKKLTFQNSCCRQR